MNYPILIFLSCLFFTIPLMPMHCCKKKVPLNITILNDFPVDTQCQAEDVCVTYKRTLISLKPQKSCTFNIPKNGFSIFSPLANIMESPRCYEFKIVAAHPSQSHGSINILLSSLMNMFTKESTAQEEVTTDNITLKITRNISEYPIK